jgi:hypothetical protein
MKKLSIILALLLLILTTTNSTRAATVNLYMPISDPDITSWTIPTTSYVFFQALNNVALTELRIIVDPIEPYGNPFYGEWIVHTMTDDYQWSGRLFSSPDMMYEDVGMSIYTIATNIKLEAFKSYAISFQFKHPFAPMNEVYAVSPLIDEFTQPWPYLTEDNNFLVYGGGHTWSAILDWHFGRMLPFSVKTTPTIDDIIDFIAEHEDIEGIGPGNSANNKYNAFMNMLLTVADLIEAGNNSRTCGLMNSIMKKCDGLPKPPDFIDGNTETMGTLMGMLDDLTSSLECE